MTHTMHRRLRGMLGMAVFWGVALSALATTSLGLGVAAGVVPRSVFGPAEFAGLAMRGFLAGALAGLLFATVLARAERRRTVGALSARRAALWGFLAAVAIPFALAAAFGLMPFLPAAVLAAASAGFGLIGATLGAGTVRVARAAPELALPHAPDDA